MKPTLLLPLSVLLFAACTRQAEPVPALPAPTAEDLELRVGEEGLATLSLALARAAGALREGRDVTLHVPAGEYREFPGDILALHSNPGLAGQTSLVIEGDPAGGSILSGALPASDFAPEAWTEISPGLLRAPWPQHWTPHPGPWLEKHRVGYKQEAARREQLFVNGLPLRLVLLDGYRWEGSRPVHSGRNSVRPEDLRPGEFAVLSHPDIPAESRGFIWMRLPQETAFTPALRIDVPRFTGRVWRPLLEIDSVGQVTLRHLSVRHANAGPSVEAVAINRADRVVIEDCAFDDNVNGGLKLSEVRSGRLARVSASRNGSFGIVLGECRDLVLEECVTSDNNFRGVWENFIHWHPAGLKLGNCHGIRILRHRAVGNHASGIWTDVWGTDIEVRDSLAFGNRRVGIMLELSKTELGGGYRVLNSLVAHNLAGGVFFSNAIDCRVDASLLAFNGGAVPIENAMASGQVVLKGHDRPGTVLVRDMRPLVLENSTLVAPPGTSALASLYSRTTAADLQTLREGLQLRNLRFAGDPAAFFRLGPEQVEALAPAAMRGESPEVVLLEDFPDETELYAGFLRGHPLETQATADILRWRRQRDAWWRAGPGGVADPTLIE